MALFGSRSKPAVTFDRIPRQAPAIEADQGVLDAAQALEAVLEERRAGAARLGDVLRDQGALEAGQLSDMLTMQSSSGKRLGALLVEFGLVSESAVSGAIATQLGLPLADLGQENPDPTAVAMVPESAARSLRALPMAVQDGHLLVAVEDPLAPGLLEALARSSRLPVRLAVAAPGELRTALNTAYRTGAAIDDLVGELDALASHASGDSFETDVSDSPVVKIVNLILTQAVRDRASDIHIEPRPDGLRVRNRIDGALHEDNVLPLALGPAVVSRIKVLARMNIIEKRLPQDGQIKFSVDGAELDLRVSTTPVLLGEKVVLRVLDKSRATLTLSDLGMPEDLHREFSELAHAPTGMIVCAGPTGSGKTTTLYATLNEIESTDVNVMTVEDPVEYVMPNVNQTQINEAAGLTFASSLRAILRQDPDVILVGEIRDSETATIATRAAMTGHFVLSTVHATDAVSALHRFLDMGIEPFLISSSLSAVVGQRLLRRVCEHCKAPYSPDERELALYRRMGGVGKEVFQRGLGCNLCASTGYSDRIGVYEVLKMTDEIRDLVTRTEKASQAELRAVATAQGTVALKAQALRLVEADITTIAEVARSIHPL